MGVESITIELEPLEAVSVENAEQPKEVTPKSKIAVECFDGILGQLDLDVGDPRQLDPVILSTISMEHIDGVISQVLKEKTFGEVKNLALESGDDIVSRSIRVVGQRAQFAQEVAEAKVGVDLSGVHFDFLSGGVLGQYELGSKNAGGIALDIETFMGDDWKKYVAHVLIHEAIHLKTDDVAQQMLEGEGIKVDEKKVLSALELLEGFTEAVTVSLDGGGSIGAYEGEMERLRQVAGDNSKKVLQAIKGGDLEQGMNLVRDNLVSSAADQDNSGVGLPGERTSISSSNEYPNGSVSVHTKDEIQVESDQLSANLKVGHLLEDELGPVINRCAKYLDQGAFTDIEEISDSINESVMQGARTGEPVVFTITQINALEALNSTLKGIDDAMKHKDDPVALGSLLDQSPDSLYRDGVAAVKEVEHGVENRVQSADSTEAVRSHGLQLAA